MRNLFQFILRHSTFLIFIILEGFSFYLIIQYNINQREVFINTSNNISNFIKQTTGGIKRYFNLKTENDFLNQQNAYLLNYIFINKHHNQKINNRDYLFFADKNYSFIPGIIISNSTLWQKNLITINKGTIDGISSDMAVVGPTGIIGVIFKSSSHFSTVISLLNTNLSVSVSIKKNGYNGTIKWDGRDYRYVKLEDIPSHISVDVGDTIITSGYSSIFPYGFPVGIVDSVNKNVHNNFYDIKILLFTNFRTAQHIYVIKNKYRNELLELETISKSDNEQ